MSTGVLYSNETNNINTTTTFENVATIDFKYYIEQNVFRAVNCILFVMYYLCIVNHFQVHRFSRYLKQIITIPLIKKLIHYIGLMCTILNIIKSIDERNLLNIYKPNYVLLI